LNQQIDEMKSTWLNAEETAKLNEKVDVLQKQVLMQQVRVMDFFR